MGVTQLWSVVQPCARPIKIETLNKKRLAVDSSLWIYQFLKAVRDKEGNALRNSHVVGFYRRICKLLYLGIKPIFVFDGGAPALKRQTIAGRKSRREGRREDAVRTAGKLLALQMQRRAEEEDQKRRDAATHPADRAAALQEEEEVPDNPVYMDEINMTPQERQQSRKFKKKDQYHLPDLDVSLAEMGQPNDPRVMSLEELEQYARQFESGEDINVYDFSKIDFDGPFFQSLPPSDRYNILNAARLRSRLRMGLSKDQLDNMFPDRMAFSRFQIDRVKERNELTQRLMHVNGMSDDPMFGVNGVSRVAGEKGREYVLVKNTGVEGGWALGVIDKDEGERNKPIDVDEISKARKPDEHDNESEEDEEDAFEDVPIEGLNRLPKLSHRHRSDAPTSSTSTRDILKRREALYNARSQGSSTKHPPKHVEAPEEQESLFFGQTSATQEPASHVIPEEPDDLDEENEDELQRAIAMSLENGGTVSSPEDKSHDEDDLEFENVLTDSKTSSKPLPPPMAKPDQPKPATTAQPAKFGGPLPFESLDLGSSILGKKKMQKIQEDNAGGFERDFETEKKKNAPKSLPPWFSDDLITGMKAQDNIERDDREKDRKADEEQFVFLDQPRLGKEDSQVVVDVDAIEEKNKGVITVESSDEEDSGPTPFAVQVEDPEIRMGDVADMARVEPPESKEDSISVPEDARQTNTEPPNTEPSAQEPPEESEEELFEWEESDREEVEPSDSRIVKPAGGQTDSKPSPSPSIESRKTSLEDRATSSNVTNGISEEKAEPDENEDEDEIIPASGAAEEAPILVEGSDEEDQNYSEIEDEELMLQLTTEAEEHARFASTLNQKTTQQNIEEYERELKALRTQQKKDRRDADEVTQVMITECQQLLKLFGLPYITAPMEAEAQCAELVSLGLVDGIVTDDSDVFLFGGTRIYKNMFNQAKYVECYLSSDLEREFDLTREKLIRIAHLLGSDYTEGIPGIGPVTALEIVSEFPSGLEEFKNWWTHVQTGAKASEVDQASAFRRKFRRNAGKLFLPTVFPDTRVNEAYLDPEVDADPSPFQWGVPDLDALRAYLMATIGWSPERTDEVLVPVIRDMNRRETEGTQSNITKFISGAAAAGSGSKGATGGGGGGGGTVAFAPRRRDVGKSKRMEGALEKLAERARQKRKQLATSPKDANGGPGDFATEQDRAVQADEALIAVQGSAVDGSSPSRPKRKVAFSENVQTNAESEADVPDERPKKRKTKPKKNGK